MDVNQGRMKKINEGEEKNRIEREGHAKRIEIVWQKKNCLIVIWNC